jgi:Tfp pilus assembly protein PilF
MNDLNKSIQIDPEYADAYRNRGMILINQGEVNKGISDVNKAMDLYKIRGEIGKLQAIENFLTRPTN